MPTEDELLKAIKSLEAGETSFEVCHKLAVYYYLYDKYYNRIQTKYASDSEFMEAIIDIDIDTLLATVDELMDCVAVINPKLYQNVLDKLRGIA